MSRLSDIIGICTFLEIYGTTGALECNTISLQQFWLQIGFGILIGTGLIILNNSIRKKRIKRKCNK